jgi:hypothetical protein
VLTTKMMGATLAMVLAACSDPDAYTGGGRFETLPGQMGGTLVPVDASVTPGDDGGTPTDEATSGSNADGSGSTDGRGGG